jgi:hypothetical protein
MRMPESTIIWEKDYDKGRQRASDEDRPLLLDFFKDG